MLDAGPGDDRLHLGPPGGSVLCGDGRDRAEGRLEAQRLDGCELAVPDVFTALHVAVRPRRRTRERLDLSVECRQRSPFLVVRCAPIVAVSLLRRSGAPILLGSGAASVAEGRRGIARITLRRRARRALATVRQPLLEVSVGGYQHVRPRSRPPGGGVRRRDRFAGRWTIRLAPVPSRHGHPVEARRHAADDGGRVA